MIDGYSVSALAADPQGLCNTVNQLIKDAYAKGFILAPGRCWITVLDYYSWVMTVVFRKKSGNLEQLNYSIYVKDFTFGNLFDNTGFSQAPLGKNGAIYYFGTKAI